MKNLKLISMILVSLLLIVALSTAVFADNEEANDIWSEPTNTETNTTNNTDNTDTGFNDITLNTNNTEVNTYDNSLNVENNEEEEDNNTYSNTNYTTKNTENLAETGLGNSASIIAVISVLAIVVAIYSAKKINDYNNL